MPAPTATPAKADAACGRTLRLRPPLPRWAPLAWLATARVAPRVEAGVPPTVARDGVQHSFAAYRDALESMWEGNPLVDVLRRPPCQITVLLAEHDQTVLPTEVLDLLPSPDVRIVCADDGHGFADDQPDLIATLLLEQLDSHTHTQGAVT